MEAAYSFGCTACGQCCTSAPLLSVPELFRHQHRFLGALGVRRLARPVEGISSGPYFTFTHGLDHAGPGRCPALEPSGLCRLHQEGKPVACRVVPFDALLPDFAQGRVLDERLRDTALWSVGCLFRGHLEADLPPAHAVVVKHLRVVDGGVRDALALHRRVLSDEYRFWGKAVFAVLEAELLRHAPAARTLAEGGVVTLPLVPVILTLAAWSPAARQRCLEYIEAQVALSGDLPRRASEKACPELHAVARTAVAVERALRGGQLSPLRRSPEETAALEAWLGVAPQSLASNG